MKMFKFNITGGNEIDRSQPRVVVGTVVIDVNGDNHPRWSDGEEGLIWQMLQNCADEIGRRLQRNFP